MRKLVATFCALALAGCATAPKNIEPGNVSAAQYRDYDCELLPREIADRDRELTTLTADQQNSSTMDKVWVSLGTFIIWPAYFGLLATDDHEDDIARLRGERQTLQEVERREYA